MDARSVPETLDTAVEDDSASGVHRVAWNLLPDRRARGPCPSGAKILRRFDPWPEFNLQGPSAARLAQDIEIGLSNPVRIERAVRPVGRIRPPRAAYPAVDHEVGDMYALRPEFARGALRQSTQGKLAHGKGGGQRVPLHTGAGADQQDRAAAMRYHSPCRLLDDEESAKGRHLDGFLHRFRIELSDRAMRARALAL